MKPISPQDIDAERAEISRVVSDGVVEQLNVEAAGEFKVSSAEHMLGQL